MLSKKADCFSYFIDYQLIVFLINLLPRDDSEKYRFVQQLFLLFLGSSDRWSDAFAPAGRYSSLHCPQGVALGYALLPLLGVK